MSREEHESQSLSTQRFRRTLGEFISTANRHVARDVPIPNSKLYFAATVIAIDLVMVPAL
jgi:hypothetical protein